MSTQDLEHTPGPWEADGFEVYAFEECEYHPVADCTPTKSCREKYIGEANARLVSAAPDMLEALILCIYGDIEDTVDHLLKAKAAIAKATGGAK